MNNSSRIFRWWPIFAPLAMLPLLIPLIIYRASLPPPVLSGALFYFPIFLASFMALAAISRAEPLLELMAQRLGARAALVVLTLIFALTGLYWTWASGEHSGDEGHYIIQAASLRNDFDLDIRNNLEEEIGREKVAELGRGIFHVSPASRGTHWYSYHPPGLPFLLAPLASGGLPARHLVLGLITALTAMAAWRLCRMAGASHSAALFVGIGFFGSLYGVVYASRCLPEMLGGCLIAWLCWCVFSQVKFPWRSVIVCGFCCAFLPWVHLRFYPPALLGVLFYGAAAARTQEAPGRKLARLALFLCLSLGGILLYRRFQDIMFSGGSSYAVGEVLFSMPSGLWRVFADPDGLFNVFPLAAGLLAAAPACLAVSPAHRRMTAVLCAMFGAVWLTSCGGFNYLGGAALGGRFLLAVVPLLLPAGAVLWDRTAVPSRWWLMMLALVSICLCALELALLPALGRSFAYPYRELPVVLPLLAGLPLPFCGLLHVLVVVGLTAGALVCRRIWIALPLTGLILASFLVWHASQ